MLTATAGPDRKIAEPATFADCVNLAIINRDGQLVLLRKRDVDILPGGKREAGEADRACLVRELREELPRLRWDPDAMTYWRTFEGTTPHSQRPLRVAVYLLLDFDGDIGDVGAEITGKSLHVRGGEGALLSETTSRIVDALWAVALIR